MARQAKLTQPNQAKSMDQLNQTNGPTRPKTNQTKSNQPTKSKPNQPNQWTNTITLPPTDMAPYGGSLEEQIDLPGTLQPGAMLVGDRVRPTKQPTKQPIYQPTNQPTNQSANQPMEQRNNEASKQTNETHLSNGSSPGARCAASAAVLFANPTAQAAAALGPAAVEALRRLRDHAARPVEETRDERRFGATREA